MLSLIILGLFVLCTTAGIFFVSAAFGVTGSLTWLITCGGVTVFIAIGYGAIVRAGLKP